MARASRILNSRRSMTVDTIGRTVMQSNVATIA
jgi:hypothetical protein